jgi:hypothetical protein
MPALGARLNPRNISIFLRLKPVARLFYANWCFYCRIMNRRIPGNSEVISNKDFVAAWINIDRKSQMLSQYNIRPVLAPGFYAHRLKVSTVLTGLSLPAICRPS